MRARIEHNSETGFVAFSISDLASGDVLAEAFTIDDRFKFDGDVGIAVNNDSTGIDNITVTTQDSLTLKSIQTLEILGDVTLAGGTILELDIADPQAFDRLISTGSVGLGGTLDAKVAPSSNLQIR